MQGVDTLNIKAPFPGLRPFEASEKDFFFGRERQLDELLRKIRSSRFLAVVGSSGNGKSSFIRSMLIPRLQDGFAGQAGADWRVCICNPGNNPLENLSRQLAQRNVLHGNEKMDPSYPAKIEGMLRNGSLGIVEAFKKSEIQRGENLIIVVDQFEEIFNFSQKNKRNEEDAATFVNLLLNASRQKEAPIYVLFTMRSSFIGACAEFRGLAESINDGQFLIPRIKSEDLKRIIVHPIQHERCAKIHGFKAEIEDDLVDTIIKDLGKNTDELGTLQHAMLRMWNYWLDKEQDTDVPIGMKHYKGVGTVKGAMARHAEEAYADLDTEEKRIICERIFRAMVEKSNDGNHTSRAVTVKEMMNITGRSLREVRLVIYTFSQSGRRFLTAPPVAEIDEDSVVTIAHESLIKRWTRLKGWANDEAESAEMYARLCAAAALFYEGKGSLWKNPELQLGLKWFDPETNDADFSWKLPPNQEWAKRYESPLVGYGKAIEFLLESDNKSSAANTRVREQVVRKEETRKRVSYFGVALVLFFLALTCWALYQAAVADRSRFRARQSELESKRQTYLAELSKQESKRQKFYAELSKEKAEKEKSRAESANLTAMEAAKIAEKNARNAAKAKRDALNEKRKAEIAKEQAERDRANAIASQAVAEKAKDEAVKQKEIATKVKGLSLAQSIAVKSVKEENEDIQGLLAKEAFDLNNANEGDPKDAFVYEAVYKALLTLEEVNKNNPDFNALDQAPDGRSRIGRIRSIQVPEGDGKIFTVGSDGLLLKWNFGIYGSMAARKDKTNKPEVLSSNLSVSRALDISPDGKFLARAGDADKVIITDAESGQDVAFVDANKGKRIWDLRYTPSGDGLILLADAGEGNTSILYANLEGATSPIIGKTPERLTSIDVSSDGKYVAGVGKTDVVDVWNIQNQRREFELKDAQSDKFATAVAFNPQGRFVCVGYQDGTLIIWDLNRLQNESNYAPEKFLNHNSKISDVAFSPDGSMLVVGSLDKTATLWNIRDDEYRGYENFKEFPYTNPKYTPIKLSNHQDWVTSVDFSNDGSRVLTATANGKLRIWEVDMTIYADQICDIIRMNLSDKSWKKYVGTDDPEDRKLYIEIPDGGRRIPLSTCGEQAVQMKDLQSIREND